MYYEYLVSNFGPQVKQAALLRALSHGGKSAGGIGSSLGKALGLSALGAGGLALSNQLGRISPDIQNRIDSAGSSLADLLSKAYAGVEDKAHKAGRDMTDLYTSLSGKANKAYNKASGKLSDLLDGGKAKREQEAAAAKALAEKSKRDQQSFIVDGDTMGLQSDGEYNDEPIKQRQVQGNSSLKNRTGLGKTRPVRDISLPSWKGLKGSFSKKEITPSDVDINLGKTLSMPDPRPLPLGAYSPIYLKALGPSSRKDITAPEPDVTPHIPSFRATTGPAEVIPPQSLRYL